MLLDPNATRQHCKEAESTETAGRRGGRALLGRPVFSGGSGFLHRPSRAAGLRGAHGASSVALHHRRPQRPPPSSACLPASPRLPERCTFTSRDWQYLSSLRKQRTETLSEEEAPRAELPLPGAAPAARTATPTHRPHQTDVAQQRRPLGTFRTLLRAPKELRVPLLH